MKLLDLNDIIDALQDLGRDAADQHPDDGASEEELEDLGNEVLSVLNGVHITGAILILISILIPVLQENMIDNAPDIVYTVNPKEERNH